MRFKRHCCFITLPLRSTFLLPISTLSWPPPASRLHSLDFPLLCSFIEIIWWVDSNSAFQKACSVLLFKINVLFIVSNTWNYLLRLYTHQFSANNRSRDQSTIFPQISYMYNHISFWNHSNRPFVAFRKNVETLLQCLYTVKCKQSSCCPVLSRCISKLKTSNNQHWGIHVLACILQCWLKYFFTSIWLSFKEKRCSDRAMNQHQLHFLTCWCTQ